MQLTARLVAGAGNREGFPPAKISCTVISFSVSVPVLSEQMTVVLPSVSTAGRLRMIARRPAMRLTPMASTTVTAAGRPSGNRADCERNGGHKHSSGFSPRQSPMASVTTARPTISQSRSWLNAGDLARQRRLEAHRLGDQPGNPAGFGLVAGGPNNTFALTKGRQRAGKARLRRSARIVSSASGSQCLWTGTDSPVSADSSICRLRTDVRRRSAGTRSPDWISTMSPGTSCSDGSSSALSVPAHGDLGQNQPREGLDGVLRLALLNIADDRVNEDDPEDYRGVDPLAEPGCYSGGRQQDVNEGRVELKQEALPLRGDRCVG